MLKFKKTKSGEEVTQKPTVKVNTGSLSFVSMQSYRPSCDSMKESQLLTVSTRVGLCVILVIVILILVSYS